MSIPLADRPGETMVTIVKTTGRPEELDLSQLLIPSRVNLSFQYEGERPFLHLVRSLPAIAGHYLLFVTVVNDPEVEPAAPIAGADRRPDNARLAIRLDYAKAVLNQSPFTLEISDKARFEPPVPPEPKCRDGAEVTYNGFYRLDREQGWQLWRISPQRLGLSLDGKLEIKDPIRYRDIAITPRREPGKPFPQFVISGRFQFPYQMEGHALPGDTLGLALSARAAGSRGSGSVRVNIREGLPVNIAGLLHHLLAVYANAQLIGNEQLHPIADEKIRPFLRRLGVATPQGWKPRIRRAAFVVDPKSQKEWLILTFRLDPPPGIADRVEDPPADRDLLVPPSLDEAPGRVMAVEARGVPGSMAAGFAGLKVDNPLVAGAVEGGLAKELSLTVNLDADDKRWFEGLADGPEIFFFRDNARDVERRIFKVLDHSVDRAVAVKLTATAGSRFLRDVLAAALGQPHLNLGVVKDDATLRVEAVCGRGGSRVALTMLGGPLVLETPGEAELDLGNKTAVRKARLELRTLTADGDVDGSEVRATLDGSLRADWVKWRGDIFEQVGGRLVLSLFSKPGRRELATGTVADAKFMGTLLGMRARVTIQGKLPVRIDRDLNVDTDLTLFKAGRRD